MRWDSSWFIWKVAESWPAYFHCAQLKRSSYLLSPMPSTTICAPVDIISDSTRSTRSRPFWELRRVTMAMMGASAFSCKPSWRWRAILSPAFFSKVSAV